MLEQLKQEVCGANCLLPKYKLITLTWGNVSGIDRATGLVVIKPSGVEYDEMSPDKMVVVDLSGKIIEGELNPSSDTATHIELYKKYPSIGGIVHTHSTYATSWSQSNRDIPAFGTTHADYMYGDIPCTRRMTTDEIGRNYEKETGKVIVETLDSRKIDASQMPGIIVANHGPFAWGGSPLQAVENAVVLEKVAEMAIYTLQINRDSHPIQSDLLDKHYLRKHGTDAYYGQVKRIRDSV